MEQSEVDNLMQEAALSSNNAESGNEELSWDDVKEELEGAKDPV